MYMLDTNICSFILKNRDDRQLQRKLNVTKNLYMSSITYGEICYGIEKGAVTRRQESFKQLEMFTKLVLIEAWDTKAAKHYGAIRAHLEKLGKKSGNNDFLIAAHARSIDAVIVTNNTSEFLTVPDLIVEDWIE